MHGEEYRRSRRGYLAALVTTAGFGGCLGLEESESTPSGTRMGTATAEMGTADESGAASTGESLPPGTRWTFDANGPFVGGPVYADGTVIVTSVDRHVYGVDETSGARQWDASTETELDNGLTVVDGTVVAAGIEEQLGVDAADGTPTYQHVDFDLGVLAQTSDDRRAYQARPVTGGVRAVDPTTGEVAWSDRTAKPTDAEQPNERVWDLALDGDILCAGVHPNSRNGSPPWGFAGYDADTGEQLWYVERDLDLDSSVYAEVAVSGGVCYGSVGDHYMAIDARSGVVQREVENPDRALSMYGATNGIVVASVGVGLEGIDVETDETVWQSDAVPSDPASFDGSTFWFVSEGSLYEIDVPSGTVHEHQSVTIGNTSLTGDLVVTDETVFVTTDDATLRALERQ
ncbi:PQQ-like beta-propeller repeat protein [Haloarcula laminariae]|uniref:PQQ-like beta-propeller repeat protein n=1 Tax=Haloarcula laminariae TaxID=2961577 RepID=UPI0021C72595|nr:PQQ-like beta-propeller repeat protein [Halomicroarcula laminariae]